MKVLELVEQRRPAATDRYQWRPYVEGSALTYTWWRRHWDLGDRYSLWSVLEDGAEVARIELDDQVEYDHYDDVPPLGPAVLEVDFFEVLSLARRRGIGRAALELIAEHCRVGG